MAKKTTKAGKVAKAAPAAKRAPGKVAFYKAELAPRAERTEANTKQMSIRPPLAAPRLGFTLAESITRPLRPESPSK